MVTLGFETFYLRLQGLMFLLQLLAATLIFRQGDNGVQVSLGQPRDLMLQRSLPLTQHFAPLLQFLRQPMATVSAFQCVGNTLGMGHRSRQTNSSS